MATEFPAFSYGGLVLFSWQALQCFVHNNSSMLINLFAGRSSNPSNPPGSGASFRHACFRGVPPTFSTFRVLIPWDCFLMSYLPAVRQSSYVPFLQPWAQEVSTWWAKLCCLKAQKCRAGFLLVCETLNNLVYSGI